MTEKHTYTTTPVSPPTGCIGQWLHYSVFIPSQSQEWFSGTSPLSGDKLEAHIKDLVDRRIKSCNVAAVREGKKERVGIFLHGDNRK